MFDWPANAPDLNPIENLWDIVKRKTDAKLNITNEMKATIKATRAFITPQQCNWLIASMPHRTEAII